LLVVMLADNGGAVMTQLPECVTNQIPVSCRQPDTYLLVTFCDIVMCHRPATCLLVTFCDIVMCHRPDTYLLLTFCDIVMCH